MHVLNEIKQLMERIEGQMASDAQLIKDTEEERTELFERALRGILGSKFSVARYQYLLSLVNQIGLHIREDVEADKENTPICSVSEGERNADQEDLAEDSSTVAKEEPTKNSRANLEKTVENHLTGTRSGRLVTRK